MEQTYSYEYYKEKSKKLNRRDCVKFALFCAKTVNNNSKESNECIELVEKWLKDETLVASQKLCTVAYAASDYTIVYAIYAACVASVYYSSSYAASAAISAIKVDPNKIEEINNYLEGLMNKQTTYDFSYFKEKLKKLDKRDCVKFALFCAKAVNPNTKESNACIELVEKWLKDEKSVAAQNLYYDTNNAYIAAYHACFSSAIYDNYAGSAARSAIKVDPNKIEEINNYLEGLMNKQTTYDFSYYIEKLQKLDKKDCVKFALFCAKAVNPNTKESNHCIELVETWLVDENSVSTQKLYDVINNAYIAAYHACFSSTLYANYAGSAAVYTIKADPNITEEINYYLEKLINKNKQIVINHDINNLKNQLEQEIIKILVKQVLTIIEKNPKDLMSILDISKLDAEMKKNYNNYNKINTLIL